MPVPSLSGPVPVPEGWPEGKPLAIVIDLICEQWDDGTAPGLSPMGNPLIPGTLDTAAIGWAQYGATTGVHRLFDIADSFDVKCAACFNGIVIERWPEIARRAADAGHTLFAHCWSQDKYPIYMSAEEEDADIKRCIAAHVEVTGTRPMGFGSPRGTPSENTAELLAANGFRWMVDAMNADLPYVHETVNGPIVVVPWTMDVNDLPSTLRYGNAARAVTEDLRDIIEGYPSIGSPHAVLDIGVHSHVSGRPIGAIQFRKMLEMIVDLDWVWITTRDEIADLVHPVAA